jgi:Outer membrane protein beta-barrel domain
MRFFLFLAVILTVGLSAASAQEREFGVKAGPSFSAVSFDPDQGGEGDYDRRVGADGGGFAVLPMTGRLALQLEAMFTSKGAKLYDPEEDLTGSVLLQYFDVPALVRVSGPTVGPGSIHVFAGPSAGVRLSAKRQISRFAGGITTGEKTDMSDEIERFEVGFVIGAGLNIGRRIVIDGRYLRGLTSVDTDTSDGVKIKNRGFSILAGARF